MHIFVSNKVDSLLFLLKETLFQKQDPFCQRYIVVSDYALVSSLQNVLPQLLSTALCGIHWRNLHQFMLEILSIKNQHSFLDKETLFFRALSYLLQLSSPPQALQEFYLTSERLVSLASFIAEEFFNSYFAEPQEIESFRQHDTWYTACFESIMKQDPTHIERDPRDKEIHCFALSHIPPLLRTFSEEMSISLYVYHKMVTHRGIRLSPPLLEENPLCTALSTFYQESWDILEQVSHDALFICNQESYALAQLQNDLLEGVIRTIDSDDSIILHLCHSSYQEVQVLLESIRLWVEQGIAPHEIVVYAPSIAEYRHAICAVFESQIPYRIMDLSFREENDLCRGFALIRDLIQEEWSPISLQQLLFFPLLMQRYPWIAENQTKIARWIDQLHVTKGYHPSRSIERSWREGLEELVTAQALGSLWIDISDFSCIEMLYQLLHQIDRDLQCLQPQPLSEWIAWLQAICLRYFASDDTECFFKTVHSLTRYAQRDDEVSFEIFYLLCERGWERERTSLHRTLLHGVLFCSIGSAIGVPCQAMALLGMDQERFPRQDHGSWRWFLTQENRHDLDRRFFIEALATPRKYLFLSTSLGDEYLASHLLHTIRGYVTVCPHPTSLIDPRYFSQHHLLNRNKKHFLAATAVPRLRPKEPFTDTLSQEVWELSALRQALTYPMRYLLRKRGYSFWKAFTSEQLMDSESHREKTWIVPPPIEPRIPAALHPIEEAKRNELSYALAIDPHLCKEVMMLPAQKELSIDEKIWIPLVCHQGTSFFGSIGLVHGSTLILSSKRSWYTFLSAWPSLVLAPLLLYPIHEVLFGARRYPIEGNEHRMQRYLQLIGEHPWLIPEFIEPILKNNASTLSQKRSQVLLSPYYQEIHFLENLRQLPSTDAMLALQSTLASILENPYL